MRNRFAKRALDLVIGFPLALAATPVILALAVMLGLQHRTWPFFVHERIGEGGKLFSFPKLRTLPPNTNPYADKTVTPLRCHTRLTKFLRDNHLDELPQLYLVVLGRMSLVGPRPKMPDSTEPIADTVYAEARISVPQGCTGLWQVSVHSTDLATSHPQYDLFYVRYGSIRLDLWILWRTFTRLFGQPGIRLADVADRVLPHDLQQEPELKELIAA